MSRWCAGIACVLACSLPEAGLAPGDAAPRPAADAALDTGGAFDAPGTDAAADAPLGEAGPVVTAGDALSFAGGSYVDMGVVPIPPNFTLEAWIDPNTEAGETCVVAEDKRNQGAGQFRLGLASSKLFFLMSDATGATHGLYAGGYALVSAQPIPTGVWTHVAVTKSGADFALVVNGVTDSTFTADAAFAHGGPPVAFRVGARVDTNGTSADGAFNGVVDEVRFWNVTRSAGAIAQTMSATVPPATPGLYAYWRFDEGTGTIAADEESDAHPGTLVSSPEWVASTAF